MIRTAMAGNESRSPFFLFVCSLHTKSIFVCAIV